MSKDDAAKNKFADYSYAAMSNLVTKADRRTLPKPGETTGEPDTLAGRASVRDMGSRARAPANEKPKAARQTVRSGGASKKRKPEYAGPPHMTTNGQADTIIGRSIIIARFLKRQLVSKVSSTVPRPRKIVKSLTPCLHWLASC